MSQPTYSDQFAKNPAQNYERYFVPVIGGPVASGLVQAAALRPGERVLDVACGTGAVTRLAAQAVGPSGTIAGLDPNPGMLAVARETAPPGTSIDWYESPAERIPLPDEAFDAVLCGMGLQFFSDKRAGLREIRRVLVEGGRFVANVPGPTPPPFEILAEGLGRYVSPEAAAFVHVVFSLHDPDELRSLAADAGFGRVDVQSAAATLHLPPPKDFLWQYVHSTPLAGAVTQVDDESRAALERDFTARCQRFAQNGGLTGRVNMTILTAGRGGVSG